MPSLLSRLEYAVAAITVIYIGYIVCLWTYNLFFHPLRSYPGPFLRRVSRLPYCYRVMQGTYPFHILELHKKYGPVVRIAPDELAFAEPAAWKDIMGHRSHGDEMMKWSMFYRPVEDAGMVTDIVFSEREEHGALRRQLAHGFSEKSMQNQEPLIRKYVDMLIDRLHEKGQGGLAAVNMADWYNFTTFDVIGDLAFGESFGCLEDSDYHPWVKAIFELGRVGVFFQAAAHYPMFQKLLMSLIPKSALERRQHHIDLNKAKLQKRMELGQDRPDLIEGLLQKKDDWNLDMEKLEANSALLIIGGSETTATLLSGVTYLLLMNQSALDRLTHEVRSAFSNEEDITLVSAGQLPYMLACLEEALRMYPPVPLGLPRVVPKGGATVAGHFVPEKVRYTLPITNHEVLMRKTVVAVHQWAMYHNDKHFRDPFSYHPERFLGDEQFASDNRDAFQPFHTGPRNCIGRNLAYAEMRLILARVIFNFDMKIADESKSWMDQKVFNLWNKGKLFVYLTPVRRRA